MNVSEIIDTYIIDFLSSKTFEVERKNFSILTSIIVFLLSIFSETVANSIVFEKGFNFFCFMLFTRAIALFFIILVYLFSVILICLILRRQVYIIQLLCRILNCFSLFFLLLPVSLICYYFSWSPVYVMFKSVISVAVPFNILRYSKVYLNFNLPQLFLVVVIPMLILLLPLLYILSVLLFVSIIRIL